MRLFKGNHQTSLAIALFICLSTPAVPAALDIAEIWIITEYELTDGVPVDSHPWDFEMEVTIEESGTLDHIDFLKPGAGSVSGTFVEAEPGVWLFDPPDYTSLAALQADYPQGTYTLEFRDGADGLLRTVALDYTVSAPDAAVDFTYPSEEGQTGVSTQPTFTWTVAPAAGDGLAAGVDDLATGDTIYFLGPSALTVTSWAPGPLLANHMYDLNVDVANAKDWTGPDWPTMTVDGDEFYYALVFTYFNEISFTTHGELLWPLQVGQVWEYQTTDSRLPGSPWTTEQHVLEIVDFGGRDYYHLGKYESNTDTWESGVMYVYSDDQTIYIRDEGVEKEWTLSTMVPEHISVPYGEFDGFRTTDFHEQDWYNWFVPGVGHVKWQQVEPTYTVTVVLVDIRNKKPVYRFWSDRLGHHFYTISETEKNKLIDQYAATWAYEGPAYQAFAASGEPGTLPVYRFWSNRYSGHFYTISESEKNKLITTYSHVWTYEGPAFYAYPDGQQPAGTSPVYRFWSNALGGHFYTIRESEKDKLVTQYPHVWAYEGVAWHAYE